VGHSVEVPRAGRKHWVESCCGVGQGWAGASRAAQTARLLRAPAAASRAAHSAARRLWPWARLARRSGSAAAITGVRAARSQKATGGRRAGAERCSRPRVGGSAQTLRFAALRCASLRLARHGLRDAGSCRVGAGRGEPLGGARPNGRARRLWSSIVAGVSGPLLTAVQTEWAGSFPSFGLHSCSTAVFTAAVFIKLVWPETSRRPTSTAVLVLAPKR
jgi:hypothetical protein